MEQKHELIAEIANYSGFSKWVSLPQPNIVERKAGLKIVLLCGVGVNAGA